MHAPARPAVASAPAAPILDFASGEALQRATRIKDRLRSTQVSLIAEAIEAGFTWFEASQRDDEKKVACTLLAHEVIPRILAQEQLQEQESLNRFLRICIEKNSAYSVQNACTCCIRFTGYRFLFDSIRSLDWRSIYYSDAFDCVLDWYTHVLAPIPVSNISVIV
jgi:hypothetical protein